MGVPAYAQPRSDPGVTVDVDDDPAEPVVNPRVSSVGLTSMTVTCKIPGTKR